MFVVQPPYLLFYPDRNHEDLPDGGPELLLTGFGMEDAHAFANSFQFGPDGWLYGAHGSTDSFLRPRLTYRMKPNVALLSITLSTHARPPMPNKNHLQKNRGGGKVWADGAMVHGQGWTMLKILIIDDDDLLREALLRALRQKGFATLAAKHGDAGVRLAGQHLPDLILCDVNLEQGNGHTVVARLRQGTATAGIPVILMSGQVELTHARTPAEPGAGNYLAKPFTMAALFEAITARLAKHIAAKRGDCRERAAASGKLPGGPAEEQKSAEQAARLSLPVPGRRPSTEEPPASIEQLRALAARRLAALEAEKSRIARVIHDDFAQNLTALTIELSLLESSLQESPASWSAPQLRHKLGLLRGLVEGMIKSARQIESELRPRVLDEFGLIATLEWQSQKFQQETGIQCEFCGPPADLALDSHGSTEVFRLFQEILSNVVRHAAASRVEIRVEENAGWLRLEVGDNGRGITEKQIAASESIGLLGIRERALLLGGNLSIAGVAGKGTTVTLEVPTTRS